MTSSLQELTRTVDSPESLPWQDHLEFVELGGLAKANNGEFVTLTIPREVPDALSNDLNRLRDDGSHKPPIRNVAVKPSWIGSNIGLKLEVGELICSGRAGWVYEIKVITTPDKFTPELPPLVIKIAKQSQGRRVSEEAGVYEQLREFQGRFIPQSYGYFRRPVNLQELTVMPWDPTCTFPRSEDTFDIYNMPHPCASLNLFLMERLGPSLEDHDVEIRQDVDALTSGDTPKDILILRGQLMEMCRAVATSGILHLDIQPANILRASLSGSEKPVWTAQTGQSTPANPWRMVDWELARKYLPKDAGAVLDQYEDQVNYMLENSIPFHYSGDEDTVDEDTADEDTQ